MPTHSTNDKKIFSIYKLDLNHLLPPSGIFNKELIEHAIKDLVEVQNLYEEVSLSLNKINGLSIKVFYKNRYPDGIWHYIKNYVAVGDRNTIEHNFRSKSCDTLIFFYKDGLAYGVSSGQGFRVLIEIADKRFPIDLLKRSVDLDFKFSETNSIAGHSYSEHLVFRNTYQFSRYESFGKIWKRLGCKIRSDSLIKSHFGVDGNLNAIFKHDSFKISKSLKLEDMALLIQKIEEVLCLDIPDGYKEAFNFIESMTLVTLKEKVAHLKKEFVSINILPIVKGIVNETPVEFCPNDNIDSFLCADLYEVKSSSYEEEFEFPDLNRILIDYRTNYNSLEDLTLDECYRDLANTKVKVTYDSHSTDTPVTYNLLDCLHGELEYSGSRYFNIGGKFYKISEYFQNTVQQHLISIIDDLSMNNVDDIKFLGLQSGRDDEGNFHEGIYNASHIGVDNFLCFDRVLAHNIELFDLCYVHNDSIYIIHVKKGFDGKTRDACSQIENSAKYIEEAGPMLYEEKNENYLYEAFYKAKNYSGTDAYKLSVKGQLDSYDFESFSAKFRNNRIYVLLFITNGVILSEKNIVNRFKSNIARYELVNTHNTFKQKHSSRLKVIFL